MFEDILKKLDRVRNTLKDIALQIAERDPEQSIAVAYGAQMSPIQPRESWEIVLLAVRDRFKTMAAIRKLYDQQMGLTEVKEMIKLLPVTIYEGLETRFEAEQMKEKLVFWGIPRQDVIIKEEKCEAIF